MIVKLGFNTDFGRDKFDIGLDETDLARILTEAGIAPDAPLVSTEVFLVLHAEAEWYCAGQRAAVTEGKEAEHWKSEAARLGRKRRELLERIKARYGAEAA